MKDNNALPKLRKEKSRGKNMTNAPVRWRGISTFWNLEEKYMKDKT